MININHSKHLACSKFLPSTFAFDQMVRNYWGSSWCWRKFVIDWFFWGSWLLSLFWLRFEVNVLEILKLILILFFGLCYRSHFFKPKLSNISFKCMGILWELRFGKGSHYILSKSLLLKCLSLIYEFYLLLIW